MVAAEPRHRGNNASGGPSWGWTTAAVLLTALPWAVLILPRMIHPGDHPPFPAFAYADFRDTVWTPVHDLANGNVPWDIHQYLARHPGAQEFLLYLPIYFPLAVLVTVLPYSFAAALWLILIAAALTGLVHRGLGEAVLRRRPWLIVPVTLALSLTPCINQGIRAGQLATVCALGAVVAMNRRTPLAALGLTVALIKPPVGLPLIIILLLTRAFRLTARGLALGALICLPFGLIVFERLGGFEQVLRVARSSLQYAGKSPEGGTGAAHSTRVDVIGALGSVDVLLGPTANAVVVGLAAALTLAATAACVSTFGIWHPATMVAFAAAMVAFVPNELYAYAVALPGLILSARHLLAEQGPRFWLAALFVTAAFPLVNINRITQYLGFTQTSLANGIAILLSAIVALAWALRTTFSDKELRSA